MGFRISFFSSIKTSRPLGCRQVKSGKPALAWRSSKCHTCQPSSRNNPVTCFWKSLSDIIVLGIAVVRPGFQFLEERFGIGNEVSIASINQNEQSEAAVKLQSGDIIHFNSYGGDIIVVFVVFQGRFNKHKHPLAGRLITGYNK